MNRAIVHALFNFAAGFGFHLVQEMEMASLFLFPFFFFYADSAFGDIRSLTFFVVCCDAFLFQKYKEQIIYLNFTVTETWKKFQLCRF